MLAVLKVITYVCFVALFAAALHIMKDIDCCTYAQSIWINKDNDTLSTSSANGKMRVDVKPASSVNETVSPAPWSIISTDFIPIKKGGVHNYSLDISANNANLLHSKVIYYDSAKNETFWKFIFSGKNGTFNEQFSNSILAPPVT